MHYHEVEHALLGRLGEKARKSKLKAGRYCFTDCYRGKNFKISVLIDPENINKYNESATGESEDLKNKIIRSVRRSKAMDGHWMYSCCPSFGNIEIELIVETDRRDK